MVVDSGKRLTFRVSQMSNGSISIGSHGNLFYKIKHDLVKIVPYKYISQYIDRSQLIVTFMEQGKDVSPGHAGFEELVILLDDILTQVNVLRREDALYNFSTISDDISDTVYIYDILGRRIQVHDLLFHPYTNQLGITKSIHMYNYKGQLHLYGSTSLRKTYIYLSLGDFNDMSMYTTKESHTLDTNNHFPTIYAKKTPIIVSPSMCPYHPL